MRSIGNKLILLARKQTIVIYLDKVYKGSKLLPFIVADQENISTKLPINCILSEKGLGF